MLWERLHVLGRLDEAPALCHGGSGHPDGQGGVVVLFLPKLGAVRVGWATRDFDTRTDQLWWFYKCVCRRLYSSRRVTLDAPTWVDRSLMDPSAASMVLRRSSFSRRSTSRADSASSALDDLVLTAPRLVPARDA